MSGNKLGEPISEWRPRPVNVRCKRIYDTPDPADGLRVLITRYWPRGVSKTSVDEYVIALAPSRNLLHSFKGGELNWDEYSDRYRDEMTGELQQSEIHRLAKLSRSQTITLMCMCSEEEYCHRSLLRDLVLTFNDQ